MSFDADDEIVLTGLIKRAFRAQRMGNLKDSTKTVKLIGLLYGCQMERRIRCSLRNDKAVV